MADQTTSQQSRQPAPQPVTGMPGPGGRGARARIEKAHGVQGTLHRLLATLHPYRWVLAGAFVLVAVNTGLNLLAPYLIGQAIDQFIVSGDLAGLLDIVLLMLVTYIGVWLSSIGQGVIMARVSQRAMRGLRRSLFEHLQTLSLNFFDLHPHGELMSRLTNDMDAISRVLSQNVTELFSGVLTLAGILVVMFVINFWLALGSMAGPPSAPSPPFTPIPAVSPHRCVSWAISTIRSRLPWPALSASLRLLTPNRNLPMHRTPSCWKTLLGRLSLSRWTLATCPACPSSRT